MQTSFSLSQLADPDVADADKILRACVHCGFCTATCPTYVLLGDERDSPRGRIYLIKEMLEHDAPLTPDVVEPIDRCLSCLSCMTTCPSGVHYMHLVNHARVHIEQRYRRPLPQRLLRSLLAWLIPDNARFARALSLARLSKPLAPALRAVGLERIAAMLALAPARGAPAPPPAGRQVFAANGPRRGRVVLMAGCVAPVTDPAIGAATVRLLTRHGIEVVMAGGEACCGAVAHHLGREQAALDAARRNIDAWMEEIVGDGLDGIVITASGCGTAVKDYGYLLRNDPAYADKAARVSALAADVSEWFDRLDLAPQGALPLTVAYHAACSLQHGQKIVRQPAEALTRCGFAVRHVPEGHLCCGSAGTFNILEPKLAAELRQRKISNIETTRPDVIAAGNVGCIRHIAAGTAIPVLHPVELIDWATGGPAPDALSRHNAIMMRQRDAESAL